MRLFKHLLTALIAVSFVPAVLRAAEPKEPSPSTPDIVFRDVRYEGNVTDDEARFVAEINAESLAKKEVSQTLLEGELALLPPRLPSGLRIERAGGRYMLVFSKPGSYQFRLEFVARITRVEPWSQVAFRGPVTAIARLSAQTTGANAELQLQSGTLLESLKTNNAASIQGYLGADQQVALRWSHASGVAEVSRKAVVTVDTEATAQITPAVIRHTTTFRFEVLQGKPSKLTIALPASHTLTRLAGDQIRDREIRPGSGPGTPQLITISFIKPLEKDYTLTVYSEQAVESTSSPTTLASAEPLEVDRESGSFALSAEDTQVDVDTASGLRQVNAAAGSLLAYRFSGRPFTLALKLRRMEPVIGAESRVAARVEETRLVVTHSLALSIEKAGVYSLEMTPQQGMTVADVKGQGVEDWKVNDTADGKVLRVNFSSRVLGSRLLDVELEQSLKSFPDRVKVLPLRVSGAAKESAQLGVASAAGIRLKTAEMKGLREIPARSLRSVSGTAANPAGELLAYNADQPDWNLTLSTERLAPRVVAEIFNLVTVGDGIVGGSATIRYGLLNQGVQQFELSVPAGWKNLEFTGPNIRRKEQTANGTWLVALQDKVWDGYTLVVTYDYQFDPNGATLPIGGIHALGVERETGSVAVTTAANLQLEAKNTSLSLRRLDEGELASEDRAMLTRSALLAFQYSEPKYELSIEAKRYSELPVLSAVADRAELVTTLNEAGELLTQASFMVKNSDKQYQQFKLPPSAKFWNCYVNGQQVKAERDNGSLLVPLPRGANRDETFSVDMIYAETNNVHASLLPGSFKLVAPQTDVPVTYAEWKLYAPKTLRLSAFGGTMTVARGTTYQLRDAWEMFGTFYRDLITSAGIGFFATAAVVFLVLALIGIGVRRGASGLIGALVFLTILCVLGAMLLPALSKAKSRAQRISAVNNLKQIGIAMKVWSVDKNERLPGSFGDITNELGSDKVLVDPTTGERFIYVGAGQDLNTISPDSVVAFSPGPDEHGSRAVLLADGSVQVYGAQKFKEVSARGFILQAGGNIAADQQSRVIQQQMQLAGNGQPDRQQAPQGAVAQAPGRARFRIEVPRTGQLFSFTKVLNGTAFNAPPEPLAISAGVLKLKTFQALQMVIELSAFLAGLAVFAWQWRSRRGSFILTVGLALMLASVGHLLLAWRVLHAGFIALLPLLALLGGIWLARRYWPRLMPRKPIQPPHIPEAVPPAATALLFLCFITSASNLSAAGVAVPRPTTVGGVLTNVISFQEAPVSAPAPSSASDTVSLLSAVYSGTINDRVAQFEAVFVVSAKDPNQKVQLFANDVAVQEFAPSRSDQKLVRDANGFSVLLPRRGEATLKFKVLVKVGGDVTRRRLGFNVPLALTSRMTAAIDQPDADVDFPAAISCKRSTAREQTQVEAVLGTADRIELGWTPRVKRASDIAVNANCDSSTLVKVGAGIVNERVTLDYQVTQGELRQVRVRLPAGHRLLRVEGASIRTWEVAPQAPVASANSAVGGQVLTVDLLKGMAPAYRLMLETEHPLAALPAQAGIEVPHALDVSRETGMLALQGEEDLELNVESTESLHRVDFEEFARASGRTLTGQANVFRFLKPDFKLRVRAAAVQPHIEAVLHNTFQVTSEQLSLFASVNYTIKRAGIFDLKLEIPAGYRLENVTGQEVQQWGERTNTGPRQVEVSLKQRTTGSCTLRLEMSRTYKDLPKTLTLEGVRPLGLQKLTGFVSVSAESGIALKADQSDGLTEIPADASVGSSALAYKFIANDLQSAAAWKLSVGTEVVESWLRAEVVNTLTLGDALVSGRALVRFEVQNAPVKELRLRIPEGFRNVEISAPNIRRRDRDGEVWKLEFQSKLRGLHVVTVTWEQPRSTATNVVELTGVSAEGVERETGMLAVIARPPLQVSESLATELKPVDLRDLPDWAGRPDDATVLAYRYLRPGYKLAVNAQRHAEAEVLPAFAENVSLTSVVAEDGQMMTALSLSVRNSSRQHLEVALPEGSTVWSAFVAGQPVRPSVRNGKLLLPLERSGLNDAPVSVELTYVGSHPFPATGGSVQWGSPTLDVPFKSARWELFLPQGYAYSDFAGTMTRETGVLVGEASSFSALDYTSREIQRKNDLAKEARNDLEDAQRNLTSGNARQAYQMLNSARFKGQNDNDTVVFEQKFREGQANALVNAQARFNQINNSGGFVQNTNPNLYDNKAAEAQWTKLQQAQEVGLAKVQPIRVNLPTRGLRHAFTQVLQTETGKPMLVSLTASNAKLVSIPSRLVTAAAAFLVLWMLVAAFTRAARKPRSAC